MLRKAFDRLSYGWRIAVLSGIALIAVWAGAIGVMQWAGWMQPAPESVAQLLEKNKLEGLSDQKRMALVERVGRRIRALDFEQRQKLRRLSDRPRAFFLAMTEAERQRYMALTLPSGFDAMMQALNGMNREKRRQFVDKAVEELRDAEQQFAADGSNDRELDESEVQRIVDQGMKSYLSDASASTKIDLQPLVQQMQRMRRGFD
jgi:hypothetical protein